MSQYSYEEVRQIIDQQVDRVKKKLQVQLVFYVQDGVRVLVPIKDILRSNEGVAVEIAKP